MMKQCCNKECFAPYHLVRRCILSWFIAVLVEYSILPQELRDLNILDGLAQMSGERMVLIGCMSAILLTVVSCYRATVIFERWSIVFVFTALSCVALASTSSPSFLAACGIILTVLIFFAVYGWKHDEDLHIPGEPTRKPYILGVTVLCLALFLFICFWTLGRYYCFKTPCFDFGIFSQMFYYMKETGLPLTTVERDGLLSHFAVHVSPIYYLILPVYWLFPSPATLQWMQALIMASAMIPLWMLGKHYGLTNLQRFLLCLVLLLYPAYSGGAGYDIHENCFLTPLLFWLLYGIAKNKIGIISVASICTLAVKEDAAVYVAIVAVWLIVKSILHTPKKNLRSICLGSTMLVVSVFWFLAATGYLSQNGDGVMNYRYENFLYGGSTSLFTVIKSVLLNPLKAIYECSDDTKLSFMAMTMLPLMLLPLITRKFERYILLIPYILVNLMSDYQYQHDIFFQYSFGSIAFLIYLTVVNIADIKQNWMRISALCISVAIAAGCFFGVVYPRVVWYPADAIKNYEQHQSVRSILDTIPEEATVSATTYYATYLSQRKVLYNIQYGSANHIMSTEYIVLDPEKHNEYASYASTETESGFDHFVWLLERKGYSKIYSSTELVIYHR